MALSLGPGLVDSPMRAIVNNQPRRREASAGRAVPVRAERPRKGSCPMAYHDTSKIDASSASGLIVATRTELRRPSPRA